MRRWLFLVAKVTLAAGLIWFLVSRVAEQGSSFEDQIARIKDHWPWFVLAQPLFGAVLVLGAWRWKILLRAQQIQYRFREILTLTFIGFFFNQAFLGTTGGDVVKAYYVAVEQPGRRTAAVLTVFLDRLVGLMVLVMIASVAVLLNLGLVTENDLLTFSALALGAAIGVTLVLGFLFYSETVRNSRRLQAVLSRLPFQGLLKSLADAVYVYKSHRREVLLAVVVSTLLHLGVIATNVCFFLVLGGESLSLVSFLLLVPLAQMAMSIPVTPAGWGTAETAYSELFFLKTGDRAFGFSLSLLQRLTYYLWALVGCPAYLKRRAKIRRILTESEEEPAHEPEHGKAEKVVRGRVLP